MIVEMQEFMSEQTQALAQQAQKFREDPAGYVREALVDSAESLKAMKSPVRKMAHSGVKFTVVSQRTLQSLIEFEAEVVTTALSCAANRFEHASRAEDVLDLLRDQTALLPETRDRLVDEARRGAAILRGAGREFRELAVETYGKVFATAEEELPKKRAPRGRKAVRGVRSGKRAVRKTGARARKLAA